MWNGDLWPRVGTGGDSERLWSSCSEGLALPGLWGQQFRFQRLIKGPRDHNLLDRQRLLERRKAQVLVKLWKQERLGTPEEEVTLYQAPQLAEEKKVSGRPEAPGV